MPKYLGKGVDYLREWIRKCLEAKGTPTFVPKYSGRSFEGPDGSPAILVRCFGAGDIVGGGVIYGLPAELVEKIESAKRDIQVVAKELGISL